VNGRVEEETNNGQTRRMKQDPCKANLDTWFQENKITWVTILAVIAAIQVMCIGIAVYILQRIRKLNKIRAANRTVSKRKLYQDSSSDNSSDFRPRI